ncbi:MAG: DUF6242 domain-containing protein [Bacteroidaceae bacterium]|nr:DUF6242 domain-containing protein [Bacteroidaceae bacterium]
MKILSYPNKLWTIAALVAMAITLSFSSCLSSDDEIVTTEECAIVTFGVNSITSEVITKKYDSKGNAKDTVVNRMISSSDINFNIDQKNGVIYTVDSLPNWTDITKVVPTFTCYGNLFYQREDSLYYLLASGRDSVNFTKPVKMLCVSTSGVAIKEYIVKINKCSTNTDTLEWSPVKSNLSIKGGNKAFYMKGNVFAFAKNEEGGNIVSYANQANAEYWTSPVNIDIDCKSVLVFNNKFYGLGADRCIYSASAESIATWTKVSDKQVDRLLAADNYYIYALAGDSIIGSSDLMTWAVQGKADTEMLPETDICSFYRKSPTNYNLSSVVMGGISSNNDKNAVVWYKVSSSESNSNQDWGYIQITHDNDYSLPRLDNLSMTFYQDALYAIGTKNGKFQHLYRSSDFGVTWHTYNKLYLLPEKMKAEDGAASIIAVNNALWIIQENGTIWQGSIQ